MSLLIVSLKDINPKLPLEELVHRIYPYDLVLGDEGQRVVQDALKVNKKYFSCC